MHAKRAESDVACLRAQRALDRGDCHMHADAATSFQLAAYIYFPLSRSRRPVRAVVQIGVVLPPNTNANYKDI
jgi:hypothetical protein